MNHSMVDYYVDEANRVVVAEISGVRYDACDKLNEKIIPVVTSTLKIGEYIEPDKDDYKFTMPWKVRAVAHCHPEDTWDVEKGKQIALKKLDEKYENMVNKRLDNYANVLYHISDAIEEYLSKRDYAPSIINSKKILKIVLTNS